MTLATALRQGTQLLADGGIGVPRLTAEVLLAHAVKQDRTYLYAHSDRELIELEWIHFGRYLHERLRFKPTQYITGHQEFYGRDFRVTSDVLIPRPETEHLVEAALPFARGRIVDVGTGSGAIAATLALECSTPVIAVDVSLPTLRVASSNAQRLGAIVSCIQGDCLSTFPSACLDLVVSNPPYISLGDREELQPEVRDWEPAIALFADDSGLSFYRKLVPESERTLRPGGTLIMELGAGQASTVQSLFGAHWIGIRIVDDLAGIPRVIIGTFSPPQRHS